MRSCWLCRRFEECRAKLPESLLERLSPCCGWSRVSSLDYVLFLRMREMAEGCPDFTPGRGRDTSPPSCRTCTSPGEGEREGA